MTTYYENRENGFDELRKLVTLWYNGYERVLELDNILMDISLKHKIGILTLKKLLVFFIDRNMSEQVTYDKVTNTLTKNN